MVVVLVGPCLETTVPITIIISPLSIGCRGRGRAFQVPWWLSSLNHNVDHIVSRLTFVSVGKDRNQSGIQDRTAPRPPVWRNDMLIISGGSAVSRKWPLFL